MRRRHADRWFGVALVLGLLHAGASLFWTLGGTWLLDTVGQFAVDLQAEGRMETRLLLGGITALKAGGAVVPWLDHRRPPMHRWVRAVSALGAGILVVWGAAGMVGAWWGLARGAPATPAVLGHGLLWDPLFAAWGLALGIGLWASRDAAPARSAHRPWSSPRSSS